VTRTERGMRRQPPWAVRRHAPPLDALLWGGRGALLVQGMGGVSCIGACGCESCR
jgi:hypothetical protein